MAKYKFLLIGTFVCALIVAIALSCISIYNTTYETGLYEVKCTNIVSKDYKALKKITNTLTLVKYNGKVYLTQTLNRTSGNSSYSISAIERTDNKLKVYVIDGDNGYPSEQAVLVDTDFYEVPENIFIGKYDVEIIPIKYLTCKMYDVVSSTTNRKVVNSDSDRYIYEGIHERMMEFNNDDVYVKYVAINFKKCKDFERNSVSKTVFEEYNIDNTWETTTVNINDNIWTVYYVFVETET